MTNQVATEQCKSVISPNDRKYEVLCVRKLFIILLLKMLIDNISGAPAWCIERSI